MARAQRTPYVILGLLGLDPDEPRSGYELKKVIDSVVAHFWSESHGQLYPVLKQLADDNLVRVISNQAKGRKKTLYAITAKGQEQLRAWLATPVEFGKPRDELILKLFFGSETEPAVLIRHVEASRARAQAVLHQCRTWEAQTKAHPTRYGAYVMITIRAGIAQSEAMLAWADEAISTLTALAAPKPKSRPRR